MKRIGIAYLVIQMVSGALTAQDPQWEWVKTLNTPDDERTTAVVSDPGTGVIYLALQWTGEFSGDFPAGSTESTNFSAPYGGMDGMVVRYNPDGSYGWAFKIGSTGDDLIRDIHVDQNGHIYVCGSVGTGSGSFSGTELPSGAADFFNPGGNKAFIAAYDDLGRFLWHHVAEGDAASLGTAIDSDNSGVYMSGHYNGSIQFPPLDIISGGAGEDAFIVSFTEEGDARWQSIAVGNGDEVFEDIVCKNNMLAVAGSFAGSQHQVLGPSGLVIVILVPGNLDETVTEGVVSVFTTDGFLLQAVFISSPIGVKCRSVEMDDTSIFVAGTTQADAVFPLYPGNPVINQGGKDAFICAMELTGTTRWVSTLSGDAGGDEVVKDLSMDESGQLYVTGSYTQNLNTTDIPIESKGVEDVFLASFTMDGGEKWIKTAGGAGADIGNAVCADTPGVLYLAGEYQDDAAFDGELMPANGFQNAFLAKLNLNCTGVNGGHLTASVTVVEEGEVFTLLLSDQIGEIRWEYLPVESSDWQLLTADVGNPIQVTPSGTADYRAFVTSPDCPADSSNVVRVEVMNPNISFADAGQDVTICQGDSVQMKASGGDFYKWDPSDALDRPDAPDPWAKPIFTTNYIVHVTRADGLTDTDVVIINVLPRPNVNAGDDITVCRGEEVKLSALGDGELFWFRLDSAVDPTIGDPTVIIDTTSTFAVMLVDADGCRGFDDMTVFIKEPPVANAGRDRVFVSRFEAQMEATLEPDEAGTWRLESGSGVWDNPSEPDTRVSGLELGDNIFSWTVTNQICPPSVDYVTFRVRDFMVPNVITPNGDGKNDYFHIFGIERYSNSELVILNRWGEEVFRAAPYINNWDGVTQNGNELPVDTYYYVLKLEEDNVRKGFIMILR